LQVDPSVLPDEIDQMEVIPEWWVDPPPFRMKELVKHFAVDVGLDRASNNGLAFYQPEEEITLELLDTTGNVVRQSAPAEKGRIAVDMLGLEAGHYVLRVARMANGGQSAAIDLRVAPPQVI
jgi:hypothetical protein